MGIVHSWKVNVIIKVGEPQTGIDLGETIYVIVLCLTKELFYLLFNRIFKAEIQ